MLDPSSKSTQRTNEKVPYKTSALYILWVFTVNGGKQALGDGIHNFWMFSGSNGFNIAAL
jgi:hypothetical protein